MTYRLKVKVPCTACGSPDVVARKLCRPCYNKAWNAGSIREHAKITPRESFETRIIRSPKCWIWDGTKNGYGYGIFLMPGERPVRAHRYSYELYVGKIPKGKIIMHTCDNPPCVNPLHLKVGTRGENNRDTSRKHRHNYGLMHWNGKLSREQVAEIRASPLSGTVLAAQYGVGQPYISRLRRGVRRVK